MAPTSNIQNDDLDLFLQELEEDTTQTTPLKLGKAISSIKSKQSIPNNSNNNSAIQQQAIQKFHTISGCHPPWDWTLKNEIIIQSKHSIRQDLLKAGNESFLQGLQCYIFPNNQAPPDNSQIVNQCQQGQEKLRNLLMEWMEALSDIHNKLLSQQCSMYYVLSPVMSKGTTIIFVSWGVIITQSSQQLRDYLQTFRIDFSMPLASDESAVLDHSAQSLIIIRGAKGQICMHNYILSKVPSELYGVGQFDVGVILAPTCFLNSVLTQFRVQHKKQLEEQFTAVVKGSPVIPPWNVYNVIQAVKSIGEQSFVARFSTNLNQQQGIRLLQTTEKFKKQQFEYTYFKGQNLLSDTNFVIGNIKEVVFDQQQFKFLEDDY